MHMVRSTLAFNRIHHAKKFSEAGRSKKHPKKILKEKGNLET